MNIKIQLLPGPDRGRPTVVGTVSTLEGLRKAARRVKLPCDWVEVRFDLIGLAHFHEALRIIPRLRRRRKVLGTFRAFREGGGINIPDSARFEVIRRFLPAVDVLDIEAFALRHAPQVRRWRKIPLVVSYHNFKSTPGLTRLLKTARAMLKVPGAFAKIACVASSPRDLRVLRSLLQQTPRGRVAALGMGDYGPLSRFWLPSHGSVLTYGFLDQSAAPGQVSAEELAKFFRLK